MWHGQPQKYIESLTDLFFSEFCMILFAEVLSMPTREQLCQD